MRSVHGEGPVPPIHRSSPHSAPDARARQASAEDATKVGLKLGELGLSASLALGDVALSLRRLRMLVIDEADRCAHPPTRPPGPPAASLQQQQAHQA